MFQTAACNNGFAVNLGDTASKTATFNSVRDQTSATGMVGKIEEVGLSDGICSYEVDYDGR